MIVLQSQNSYPISSITLCHWYKHKNAILNFQESTRALIDDDDDDENAHLCVSYFCERLIFTLLSLQGITYWYIYRPRNDGDELFF